VITAHPFSRDAPRAALHRHRGLAEAFERLRFTIETDGIIELPPQVVRGSGLDLRGRCSATTVVP
jgi:hypothetical protein